MKSKDQILTKERMVDMVKEGEKLKSENPEIFAAMSNLVEKQSAEQKRRLERIQRLNNEYLQRRSQGINTPVKPSFSHVISELRPCTEWVVGIDESGSDFSIGGKKDSAKIVAFIAPGKVNLPGTGKSFHACEIDNLQEYDDRMQAVLSTENTGILGITADTLADFSGDRWRKGIIYLIEWVLRLLPVTDRTSVEFMVENRLQKAFDWVSTADKIILDLGSWDKKKSEKLQIKISEHPKNSHSAMDWADFLAYSWGCPQPHAIERLKRSGLQNSCFFNSSSREPEELEELVLYSGLLSKRTFPTEIWLRLFEIGSGRGLAAIEANKVLLRVKSLVAEDVVLWRKCLSAVIKLMDVRPVDLRLLHKTLEWLKSCAPENWSVNRAVKMGFMSSELARKNHIGEVASSDFLSQMSDLTNELYNENAPLCCHVALRMAVSATNDYDYDKALGFLESWRRVPVETVGLVMWARLQSQFGQIAAFRGEWQKADSFFDSALSAFRQHSDQENIASDIEQTSIYRAIVAIDNPKCPSEVVEKRVTDVLGSLEQAVFNLSVTKENSSRYKSHLLARYLLFRPDEKNAVLRELYRNLSFDPYIGEEAHPWPLIMLYKAFLLREIDEEAGRQLAEAAACLVLDPVELPTSPLIRLIGCVCAAVAVKWGSVWSELDTILQGISDSRPLLAERVQMVNNFLADKNADPLQMICEVLPFNFH